MFGKKKCPICNSELLEMPNGEASCPRCGRVSKYNPYDGKWEEKY